MMICLTIRRSLLFSEAFVLFELACTNLSMLAMQFIPFIIGNKTWSSWIANPHIFCKHEESFSVDGSIDGTHNICFSSWRQWCCMQNFKVDNVSKTHTLFLLYMFVIIFDNLTLIRLLFSSNAFSDFFTFFSMLLQSELLWPYFSLFIHFLRNFFSLISLLSVSFFFTVISFFLLGTFLVCWLVTVPHLLQ